MLQALIAGILKAIDPLLQEKMAVMVKHLASLANDRLIISFAPSTPALLLLKRIGEFFPKGAKV